MKETTIQDLGGDRKGEGFLLYRLCRAGRHAWHGRFIKGRDPHDHG